MVRLACELHGGCELLQGRGFWSDVQGSNQPPATEKVIHLAVTVEDRDSYTLKKAMRDMLNSINAGPLTSWVHCTETVIRGCHFKLEAVYD